MSKPKHVIGDGTEFEKVKSDAEKSGITLTPMTDPVHFYWAIRDIQLDKEHEDKNSRNKKGGHGKSGTKSNKVIDLETAILKFIGGNKKAFNETLKSDAERIRELKEVESFKIYSDQQLRRAIEGLRNDNKLK